MHDRLRSTLRQFGRAAGIALALHTASGQTADCPAGPSPPSYADFSTYADQLSSTYRIPAVILKAVMEQESRWTQFTDQQGTQPLISGDGGIGIMQVTPGSGNPVTLSLGNIDPTRAYGENGFTVTAGDASVDVGLLKSCWKYNMEIGARILLAKVKASKSEYLDLQILENWYYPLAFYNGAYRYLASDSAARRHECNDPINPERTRLIGQNNSLYRDKYTFPYQECVFNIVAQKYNIPSNRVTYFGSPIQVMLPGPQAVSTGDSHFQYLNVSFHFFDFAEFHNDGTAKIGASPGTTYNNVPIHRVPFSGATLQGVTKGNGVFVPNATVKLNGVTAGSTNSVGQLVVPTVQCGNIFVEAVVGALHYAGFINFQCSSSNEASNGAKAASQSATSSTANFYTMEMDSSASCGSISPVSNFSIGDRVEVYSTGNGLRARYPDPCSDSYAVMPDLSAGTIVGSWQCCSGYIRWKIRYDGLSGIDVWSAEGEPSTGQLFLRKKSSSTCSYSLAPGRLDLGSAGPAASGFNVNTGSSCYWTAVSNLDWISITTNGSASGPAQVTFSIAANNNPYSRTGNIVVGDQTFIVTQPGNGSATSGWALTVASSNPNSGVAVAVTPNDTSGLGNGLTSFTRNYNAYTQVYLTAPAGVGSTIFKKWQRDGVDWSPSTATNLTMEGNHTMTAVYVPIPDHYLAVFISPQQVVDAGAKWYIQGNGPYDSGQAIGPFNSGTTIQSGFSYTPIAGWIAPPYQSVTIANSGPTIVRVNYTLASTLSLSTNQINVGSSSGGANLLVSNTGGGNLNWSASTGNSWITLELSSGVATAGTTNPLSFGFLANDSSLDRTGSISLSAPGANGSPQSITVSQRGRMQVASVQRSAHSFTLSWTADLSHTYGVFRSADLSFANYDVIAVGIPGNIAAYTDTSLSGNTPYMFYKVALDDGTLVATSPPSGITQWPISSGGNGHYYQIVTVQNPISWTDARDAATAVGGYLATITSAAESNFVWALATPQNTTISGPGVWLGGYRDPATSDPNANWHWVTGETWSYTQWQPYADYPNVDPTHNYLKEFHDYAGRDGWGNVPNSLSNVPVYSYAVEYDSLP